MSEPFRNQLITAVQESEAFEAKHRQAAAYEADEADRWVAETRRRRSALEAYDAAMGSEPDLVMTTPTGDRTVVEIKSRRTSEEVEALKEDAWLVARSTPEYVAKVNRVHAKLVELGKLDATASGREFTRYLLGKLADEGRLQRRNGGRFEVSGEYRDERQLTRESHA